MGHSFLGRRNVNLVPTRIIAADLIGLSSSRTSNESFYLITRLLPAYFLFLYRFLNKLIVTCKFERIFMGNKGVGFPMKHKNRALYFSYSLHIVKIVINEK